MEIASSSRIVWSGWVSDLTIQQRTWILLGTLTLLTIADFLFTQTYLGFVGDEGEANPIMFWVVDQVGVYGILACKLVGVMMLGALLPFVNSVYNGILYHTMVILNFTILIPVMMGFYAVSTTL